MWFELPFEAVFSVYIGLSQSISDCLLESGKKEKNDRKEKKYAI